MDQAYEGREQTAAKHLMLKQYLEKLAYKVGFHRETLNYIDGFAGPWESNTADLSDTSPHIALATLTAAKRELAKHGKPVAVRAFFVSPATQGAEQLRSLRSRFPEAEIEIAGTTFEDALGKAQFFASQGIRPFTFTFIDHTGWTGFGLRGMESLLRVPQSEVLINFMTGFIKRFIDNDEVAYRSSFVDLFGDDSYRAAWQGSEGLDREDRIVDAYCRRIAAAGDYKHCVSSVSRHRTEGPLVPAQ